MKANKTFSKLTELETQLLAAVEDLLPLTGSLTAEKKIAINLMVNKANSLKYTPDKKPFNLTPGDPVIYRGEGWTYTIHEGRHCLYKVPLNSVFYNYYSNINWAEVLTYHEDSINNYKAYLKQHGIKKRVTKSINFFDYTLHVKRRKKRS